ncbi:MAG: porin [Burkholderiales bacterium]|nr:porin [Burkholderiales bacterium]
MKKSLLAIAMLGAFATAAQAQSNVSIGGVVQANWKSFSIGNSTRATQTEYRIDDDYTSRFWLKGSEDLGGGLSALFNIENRLNTDVSSAIGDGNGLGNGDTYLGLKGSWGQVTIGKHTMMSGEGKVAERGATGVPAIPESMYGVSSVLGFVGAQNLTHTRVLNSILYTSPKFSGFSGAIGVGTSGSNGNEGSTPGTSNYSDGSQLFLKANYTQGPIYLNLAYWKTQAEGRPVAVTVSNADQSQFRLSGYYLFPMGLKVGLQYDRATLANVGRTAAGVGGADARRSAWELPISYSFGPNTILFSYTRAGSRSDLVDSGAKMWVLGYDYALSKRTNVGVFYSRLSNDSAGTYQPYKTGTSSNGSVLVAGESASILALGLKHTF